ncbi:GNAT family N-acetyltransferase [Streptomyces sp. 8N706]|uniref:GNAT family N-acetyltransferase n=1 Tax=Streptomyces sp. 8N706 TaxID=3457416 RepID=UPI003FD16788
MPLTTAATHLSARPYTDGDQKAVLALINADRLPGQPETTPGMLTEALAGRSPVDSGWWAELDAPVTDVLQNSGGQVLGVVSYATRPRDGAGLILWLHCLEEDQALTGALIDRVLDRLGRRTVYAFEFASALSLGLEGLPVRNRPATRRALEAARFSGEDLWRYIHRRLDQEEAAGTGGPRLYPVAEVAPCHERDGWQLTLRDTDGTPAGEATVGRPVDGVGVLWWISTEASRRRRGLGRGLLAQALQVLADHGAREVIAYVDDDAPPGDPERDRTAANRLYDAAGFTEVDRLWSFTRRP